MSKISKFSPPAANSGVPPLLIPPLMTDLYFIRGKLIGWSGLNVSREEYSTYHGSLTDRVRWRLNTSRSITCELYIHVLRVISDSLWTALFDCVKFRQFLDFQKDFKEKIFWKVKKIPKKNILTPPSESVIPLPRVLKAVKGWPCPAG